MEGLKRGADSSTTISVQTLFTRTLRSLMFDNVPWFTTIVVGGGTKNKPNERVEKGGKMVEHLFEVWI